MTVKLLLTFPLTNLSFIGQQYTKSTYMTIYTNCLIPSNIIYCKTRSDCLWLKTVSGVTKTICVTIFSDIGERVYQSELKSDEILVKTFSKKKTFF